MNRWLRRAVSVAAGGAVACYLLTAYAPASGDELPAGWVQTRWGPLSPADKDLLARVHQAALWQIQAGELAEDRAGRDRIEQIGEQVREQQAGLDSQARRVAGRLGVDLPAQAGTEQQGWLRELTRARSGPAFDSTFVARLRQGHSRLLPVLASGRASTRNELIRDFTQTAVNTVLTHMTLVETTGLVNYAGLPAPAASGQAGSSTERRSATERRSPTGAADGVPLSPLFVLGLLAILAITAAVLRHRAALPHWAARRGRGAGGGWAARGGRAGRAWADRSRRAGQRQRTSQGQSRQGQSPQGQAGRSRRLGLTGQLRPAIMDRLDRFGFGRAGSGNHRLTPARRAAPRRRGARHFSS